MKNLRSLLTTLGLTLILSNQADADPWRNPLFGDCATGLAFDSFGLGVARKFSEVPTRPRQDLNGLSLRQTRVDQVCVRLGREWAAGLLGKGRVPAPMPFENRECVNHFEVGYRNGILANGIATGTQCQIAGYNAGLAVLHFAVREENSTIAGSRCLSQSRQGAQDRVSGRSANAPSDPSLDRDCYFMGYWGF